ncbi:MAG: sugar transferase [Candidatus Scalindua sp.]|jgi:lipopolysaccharide/colanic/teichoic acid biosynthesis glycosyltransferase|nr:sugar transferase [Candidatus Scalindua sp.]MBT6226623.1 sugar transferase [Candidatus Scalindua sp.]
MENTNLRCLSLLNHFFKRFFDISMSFIGLILSGWIIVLAFFLATIDTRKGGIFTQSRIGQYGKPFKVIKIRTMRDVRGIDTNVTTLNDPRITKLGFFFRKTKIDELPQLINVLQGKMSFVGPRPDVSGYADKLNGDDNIILSIKPGITGPASLKYRNEEELLAEQADPEKYNREVLFPDKVRLNREYIDNYSFCKDMKYIWETAFR